jgi:hypothetical protein
MIKWLRPILSRSKAPVVADEPSDSASAEPDDDEHTIDVPSSAEVADCMDDHESTQVDSDDTLQEHRVLDADSSDESTDFDPGDTDVLPKS